jgi:hypothetical protein
MQEVKIQSLQLEVKRLQQLMNKSKYCIVDIDWISDYTFIEIRFIIQKFENTKHILVIESKIQYRTKTITKFAE